jgi:hypothetical protein
MNAFEIDSDSYQGIASAMPNVECFRWPLQGLGRAFSSAARFDFESFSGLTVRGQECPRHT